LQIYTGGPIAVAAPTLGGPTIVSGGGAPRIGGGQVALTLGGTGGAIAGATAFFDANRNGILDPGEPATTTGPDGYFQLTIPSTFDLNNNGVLDPSEGQFVLVGGTDMATLLPQASPLVAVPGAFVISPLTTVMAALMNSQGLGLGDAGQRVIQAFNLPPVDLTTFDPTQQMLNGNADAIGVYAGIAKLEDTIAAITALVAGTPGAPPASGVGNAVIAGLARAIGDPGSTLDLNDGTALGAIIQSTLDSSGAALDPSVVAAAANIIAFGNQQIDAVTPSIDATYMNSVVRVQVIAQGPTAKQLADLAAGITDISTVTQNNTGAAFQNAVANAQTGNVVPPVLAIFDVSQVNSSTGQTAYDFTVGLSGPSVLPVSVDYATYDGSATAANGDYVPASGTLTWAAGDTSVRTIRVWVNPSSTLRPDEQFAVILANAINATTRRPVGTGVIVNQVPLSYVAPANSGDNRLDLQIDGSNVLLTRNDQVVFNGPVTLTSPLSITGADGVKTTLTVELLNGSTLPSAGLVFQGGSLGTDTLSILDASATSARQTPSGPKSGTFTIDGVTVQYSNVASATDQLTTFSPAEAVSLASSVSPSILNQPVTFTASIVAPSSGAPLPGGSVTFVDTTTGQTLGTVALANGSATLGPVTLSAGPHTITALYSGDGYYAANTGTLVQPVRYAFSGFLAPLHANMVYALGHTIPIKFQLTDFNGQLITSLGAVTSLQVAPANADGSLGTPFNPTAAGGTGLRYDPTANQYVFNWQTKGLAAGSYTILLSLSDGSTQSLSLTLSPNGAFQLAGGASSAYVSATANQVLYGTLTVAVQDDTGAGIDPSELSRITDALAYLNAALGSFGVDLTWAAPGAAADVHIHFAASTPEGGAGAGVLGFTTADNDVYLVEGWTFYTGSDPTQVGAGQYDFQTLATHELAHTVGLGESGDPGSVMYEYLAPGTARRTFTAGNRTLINSDADRYMKVGGSVRGAVAAAGLPTAAAPGANGGWDGLRPGAGGVAVWTPIRVDPAPAPGVPTPLWGVDVREDLPGGGGEDLLAGGDSLAGGARGDWLAGIGFWNNKNGPALIKAVTVSGDGLGAAGVSVGSDGDALGVANNTTMTVMDLLLATDAQAVNGVLYNGNTTKRAHANDVYTAINQAGGL
jgi:hypothetical protein